jgi:hypothetical protein
MALTRYRGTDIPVATDWRRLYWVVVRLTASVA